MDDWTKVCAIYIIDSNIIDSLGDNGVYVLSSNRWHLHTKRNLSETSRQIHLPRKQCLINRKRHRHAANEGTDSYR